jgi:hypothetical protein
MWPPIQSRIGTRNRVAEDLLPLHQLQFGRVEYFDPLLLRVGLWLLGYCRNASKQKVPALVLLSIPPILPFPSRLGPTFGSLSIKKGGHWSRRSHAATLALLGSGAVRAASAQGGEPATPGKGTSRFRVWEPQLGRHFGTRPHVDRRVDAEQVHRETRRQLLVKQYEPDIADPRR